MYENPSPTRATPVLWKAEIEEKLYAGTLIPKDSSVVIAASKNTGDNYQPKETHHYVARIATEMNNNDFIEPSQTFERGLKSFDKNMFQNDYVIHKIKLGFATDGTDAAALKKSLFDKELPDATRNTRFVINQGQDAFFISNKDLIRGNTQRDKDWYYLLSPLKLRKDIPFTAQLEVVGTHTSGAAYRLDMAGVEMIRVSSASACSF